MPARQPAIVNQIADKVVSILKNIDSTLDATNWLTEPKTVARAFLIDPAALSQKLPAMLVQVQSWEDEQLAGTKHEVDLRLSIHCLSSGNELAEKLLNDMAADVLKAIGDDHTLGGLVTDATVTSYDVQGELSQNTGRGIATVTVAVNYQWAHGAP